MEARNTRGHTQNTWRTAATNFPMSRRLTHSRGVSLAVARLRLRLSHTRAVWRATGYDTCKCARSEPRYAL